MPKVTVEHHQNQRLVLLCNEDCSRRVIVRRPVHYSDATKCALHHFPSISPDNLVIQTDELDISSGERADITPETWEIVIETVSLFCYRTRYSLDRSLKTRNYLNRGKHLKIVFRYARDDNSEPLTIECTVDQTTSFQELFQGFENHIRNLDPPIHDGTKLLTYYYNGRSISSDLNGSKTPQQLKMLDGALIECIIAPTQPTVTSTPIYPQTVPISVPSPLSDNLFSRNDTLRTFGLPTPGPLASGGFRKPVIYLFSREKMNVSVSVSLTPQWGFCALYPVVHIQKPRSSWLHQQIEWNVETQYDGSLKEKNTGLEIAYLFWEAIVNGEHPCPPRQSPIEDHPISDCFNPASCDVTPEDSVLLATGDLPAYLEKTLTVLGLHTEARTSFITYWLPSFLKHTHIALRFVPQASYDGAAPMEVIPRPDVVTRVFMLFKGVIKLQETVKWDKAVERSRDAVGFWRDVIGIRPDLPEDIPRLRVLEWGGMEIR